MLATRAVSPDIRYSQGGGLTAEQQQSGEELRLKAAERSAQDGASPVIAKDLRVSVRSVRRRRRTCDEGGPRVLRSHGPASPPRLSEKQFAQGEAELAERPAGHGWKGQRWPWSRVKTVIG
ncbi:hypothetical protein [Streptomyces sp. NPDC007070]|uniref:hypothetical protein n=1 Tax=Streptomyces sp. NPDC007070 TaxID=3154312 RepID=UPI0033EB10E1